ncbi:MAG TPA: hypothetical protein VGH86_12305 [Phenylobacterium sp.]
MSAEAPRVDVLRPRKGGLREAVTAFALEHAAFAFSVLRRVAPILVVGDYCVVTRDDDVRQVFLEDSYFPVAYAEKLKTIMDHHPFFLGMGNTETYRRDVAALRMAVRPEDLPALCKATTARATELVATAGGSLEVVDFIRQVTFGVFCDYLGVTTAPPGYDLRVIATRLFEYQFLDPSGDKALLAEVEPMAKALRDHLDGLIATRKAAPGSAGGDDVLGRCLALQAEGRDGFSDIQVRSFLVGMLYGGLPQPPMAAPHALEQLLRRPAAFGGAQAAARTGDDAALAGYVFEALRFDPLAPMLFRHTGHARVIAPGTPRAKKIEPEKKVLVALGSAMRDPRRVADPEAFDATRAWRAYLHFGEGLHTCFAQHINRALLPLMLKALLQRDKLRRAPGSRGRLTKRGFLADQLWVEFS